MPAKRTSPRPFCAFPECIYRQHSGDLCDAHDRQRRMGKLLHVLNNVPSRVFNDGESWCVELRDRRGLVVGFARISEQDVAAVEGVCWRRSKRSRPTDYAITKVQGRGLLHRWLLKPQDSEEVDHINGNGLDCRRENMRVVSVPLNAENKGVGDVNKTGHRGVYWDNQTKRYKVQAYRARKRYYGGSFKRIEDAAEAARKLRARIYTHHVEARCHKT